MKVFFSLSLVLCSLSLCGQVAVDKIERYIPSTQLTLDSVFEFVVTFDKDVLQVDTSDFSLSGTISAFTAIDQLVGSGDTYYVITSSSGAPTGTLGLDIKGVDGSGVNNIIEDNSQLDQQSLGDIQITDSKIFGQSFIPTISGDLVKVTVQTGIGHVYSGAGTMELIAGEGYGGAVLSTENINVSSALQEYTYTFTNPASISSGSVYTLRFNFPNAPAQSTAFSAQVGAGYSGGVLYQSSSFPSADLYFKTYVIPNGSLVTLSNTLPSVDETFTHVLCDVESVSNVLSGSDCQGLSGAATTAISGGTPNYSYLWSNGETNATASNLVYGLNTVTITDSLGCTATDTVFIENSCDIRVLGNSIEIFSNDITPSLLDSTDFGGHIVGSQVNVGFMIINNSAGPLQIDSIKVSGNTFSTTNTSAQIPAGDTIIQMVSFNAQNSDTATVRVYSAASVNPFSFKIKGSVLHAGLHFDGINDFVEILDNNTLDFINGFTIESWVKPDVLKTSAIISKFGNGSSNRSWALLLLSDGTVELSLSHNGASEVFFGSNAKLNVGQWNHVAYRYDGSTMNVFINGVKDINDQTTSGSVFNSTMPILIGARDNGSIQLFFEGAIDETRLWNFARPDNEIVSSANCELLGVESGLVAYYSYNEGSPNGNNSGLAHLKDRSNNSNNGDFVNLSLTNSPISNFVEGAITEVSGKCTDTLTIAIGIDSQATCFGGLGGATVTASDGFPSYSYLWSNGITSQSIIAMSGTYSVTVTDGSGDTESASIVISQPSEIRTNLTDTVCDQYFWQSTGLTYTSTGIYYDTLVSYAGCDSILQLDLTINQSFVSVDTVVACDIYTWQQNGSTYNSSGMYYDSLTTTSGCDSILALMLTINDSHLHIDTVVTCDDFYLWSQNALIYYVSGMYYDSLKTIDGCDSVIALSLTIDNHFHMDTVVACDDYTWQQNGNTYASSGVYYDSLLSVNGCDSVIALSLTINKYLDVDTIEACRNFTWQQNNSAYNASGIYYDSLSTINGCDSVFKLVLNIDTIDTILNVSGLTLSTNQTGSYQWLDCNGFTVINGETSSSFAVPANGSYALEIMNGACVDTTTCVNVISVGAVDINSNSGLQVYPNPTSGKINIAFQKGRQLTLLDQMGREVMRVQMTSDYMTIDLEHLSTGLYFLTSRSDRIKIMLE